jgi:peptidoglycan/xylan/chitin deacetylase (PgdA/CDA1 family)
MGRAIVLRGRVVTALAAAVLAVMVGTATVAAGSARVVYHGDRDERVVALTFDDGWGIEACRRIRRTLRDTGTVATFFPNSQYVAWRPRFWQRVARHFPLGNHTATHPDLTELSNAAIRRQIADAESRIEDITGVPMIKVFRPPYGLWDDDVRRIAGDLGYHTLLMWDVDSGDTHTGATASSVRRNALRGQNGSVVLLHCARSLTADALPGIIAGYRERGFRFVTVPQLLARSG